MVMTQMVRQTVITPQLISAASMLVRLGHPGEASLHRALGRAEERLVTQPWRVDRGILQIASHSNPNEVHVTDGMTCNCKTSPWYWCWHRAAAVMLATLTAAGAMPVPAIELPAITDEDDLPGSFLDGPFDWADDVQLTAPGARRAA